MKDSTANEPGSALMVRMPRGIRSKQKLLAVLSDKLRFPGYFGWNWDALEELLRDLSWLPGGTVSIVHADLPFGESSENRATYLQIMQSAVAHWDATEPGRLRLVLPAEPSGG